MNLIFAEVKRPALWLLVSYMSGIAASIWIKQYFVIVWVVVLFSLMAAWILHRFKMRYFHILLVTLFAIGAVNAIMDNSVKFHPDIIPGREDRFFGVIEQIVRLDQHRDQYDIRLIKNLDELTENTKGEYHARINIYQSRRNLAKQDYKVGDILEIAGALELPRSSRNPLGFDYRKHLLRRDIIYTSNLSSQDVRQIGTVNLSLYEDILIFIRNRVHLLFTSMIGEREGALMNAMLLGDRWLLPDEITRDFRYTGLSHIIAISGLHVGFILMMLDYLFAALPISKKVSFILKLCILWIYCVLTGASPSVLRAVIMASIYLGSTIAGRKADILNTLSLAALGILALRPNDLFDIGFQLSFVAVGGIILYQGIFEKLMKALPKWISSVLSVTLAAQFALTPLIAYHFNIVSIISLPANLIFVPLSGLMVCYGFLVMTIGIFIPFLAEIVGWPLKAAAWVFIEGAELLADFPLSYIVTVSPSILFLAGFYFILLIISEEKPNWIKRPVLFSFVLVLVIALYKIVYPLYDNNLKVVFLDVGQGDSIFIKTPDEKTILIDAGGRLFNRSNGFEPGEDIVLPFLLKNRVSNLDLLVKSHDHLDHIGGLIAVAENIKFKTFMQYPPSKGSNTYTKLMDIVNEKYVDVINAYRGNVFKVGEYVTIEILYPDKDGEMLEQFYNGDANNRSLVFVLRYKEAEVLFTGDIYQDVEEFIAKNWHNSFDLLKVAHHGSITSSSQNWINATSPHIAVIQVGNNNYGHPSNEVINRFKYNNIKVLRNDLHGAITAVFDGSNWRVTTMIADEFNH